MTTVQALTRARPAPLLGAYCRRAVGVVDELERAAQLAECDYDDEGAVDIRRAVIDAGDWARDVDALLRWGSRDVERAATARTWGEISDHLDLRAQMVENLKRRRTPGQP